MIGPTSEPNQCMGCQSKWPILRGTYDRHIVPGGYPGEMIWCSKNTYDLPTPGHCSLGACRPRTDDRTTDATSIPAGIACADFAAPGTKDQTVLFTHVTEEDFTLMLEVDVAFIDWLRRRCIIL